MSTHNIGFYEDLTKIIFALSSNIIKYAPYFFCCYLLFCCCKCVVFGLVSGAVVCWEPKLMLIFGKRARKPSCQSFTLKQSG